MRIRGFVLFLAVFFFMQCACGQGYEIKFKINGLKEQPVILGHWLNQSMYPSDTAIVNKNGEGVFRGKKALSGGLYVVYLPSASYFEMLVDKNQHFYFESDTVDFINTLKFKGSEDNTIFLDFQLFMKSLKDKAIPYQEKLKTATESEKGDLHKRLKEIGDERIGYINKVAAQHPDTWAAIFLKATLDIEVPEAPTLADGRKDSLWPYFFYRAHYFDNFNTSDPRLLRTPLYEDKIMGFVTKVIPQIPDSIIPYIDDLIAKSRSDSGLFRYMLITLFNHFAKSNIMGMDAVYVHLADNYYIDHAWWSDPKFIKELKEKVDKARPLLIGKVAPDAELIHVPREHFIIAKSDTALKRYPHAGTPFTLHQVKSTYTVLIFWEPDCGHCKTEVPKLHASYLQSLKNRGDVNIVAVSTLFGEEGKMKWIDFVNQNGLYDWINAWNPYSYQYKIKYDIASTPQIYILDKDKKIIAKKVGAEHVADIIEMFDKLEAKK